jgi:hypothetical protein
MSRLRCIYLVELIFCVIYVGDIDINISVV